MKYDKIKRILIVLITIGYITIGFIYQYRYNDEKENIEKINISGTYQETEDDLPVTFKSFEDIRSDGYKQLIVKGHFDTDIEKDVKISCPVVRNDITMKINGKECVNTPKDVFVRWIRFSSPAAFLSSLKIYLSNLCPASFFPIIYSFIYILIMETFSNTTSICSFCSGVGEVFPVSIFFRCFSNSLISVKSLTLASKL